MKQESHSEHNAIHVSGDGAALKAERLAPLEEQLQKLPPQTQKDEGALSADTGSLKLPSPLGEESRLRLFGLEPITIIIIIFSLSFIGFIAYLISLEPSKAQEEPAPVNVERQP